jgi:hypothetical protein
VRIAEVIRQQAAGQMKPLDLSGWADKQFLEEGAYRGKWFPAAARGAAA